MSESERDGGADVRVPSPVGLGRRVFLRFVACLLLLAALSKLRNPGPFAHSLAMYGLFPDWSMRPLAYFVPALELVVGLRLLAMSRAAVAWALLLFVAFTVSVGYAWSHHLGLSCGCFGRLDSGLHRLPHGVAMHLAVNCLVTGGLAWCLRARQVAGDSTIV